MIGENIKKFRTEKEWTQKDLADRLYVTAQAVSRWENGEVEPSISTVTTMAELFGVSVDEMLGRASDSAQEPEVIVKTEYVYKEAPKQALATCEKCNELIYKKEDIVRTGGRVLCASCHKAAQQSEKRARTQYGLKCRIHSFIWGGLAALVSLILAIVFFAQQSTAAGWGMIVIGVLAFTYISCLILHNNFIMDMTSTIMGWGFVTFPGLIFELSLDGIIWLLTVKLAFWLIGIVLAILFSALAIVLGALMSVIVYPFALVKNICAPQTSEEY